MNGMCGIDFVSPFQGLKYLGALNPGRCPGLSCVSPLGRRMSAVMYAADLTEKNVDYNKGDVTDPTTLGGVIMSNGIDTDEARMIDAWQFPYLIRVPSVAKTT